MTLELTTLKKTETFHQLAVKALRNAIIAGQVAPGSKLVETQIAEQLGVSRGPLREAIRQLVEEGLLESIPYRGTFVRALTVRDIQEIYTFRTAIESLAFRLVWPRRTSEFIAELDRRHERLREALRADDPVLAITSELDLHSVVYEFADHRLLFETWTQLRGRLQVYFAYHQRAHNRRGSKEDAHQDYVALARGDDLDAMLQELESHMQRGLDRLQQFVSQLTPPGPGERR